jgi:hypothetical protein
MYKATDKHHWKINDGEDWIASVLLSVFAEGLVMLQNFTPNSNKEAIKNQSLRSQGEALFFDVVEEGISHIEDDIVGLGDVEDAVKDAINFLKDLSNIQATIKEFATCARNKIQINS